MSIYSLVIKNLKRNFQKYVMYFFSLAFSVFTIYSFLSLMENKYVEAKFYSSTNYRTLLIGFSIIILVFIFFFLVSSNISFIRSRKKEISTYALFGMKNKKIGKMLFVETMFVGILALIIGIAVGIFFSKLVSMILLDMTINSFVGEVSFMIGVRAIWITSIIFISIYCIMGLTGLHVIRKFELVDLFKAEKMSESRVKGSIVMFIISVVCTLFGYSLAISSNIELLVKSAIPILILVITGTFLFFRGGLPWVLRVIKKNKKNYYKGSNLLAISSFSHRIKSIAGVMSFIAILCAVSTTVIATGYTLYSNVENNTYMVTGYDLSFYTGNDNLINDVHDAFEKNHVIVESEYKTQRYISSPEFSIIKDNESHLVSGSDGNYFRAYSNTAYNKLVSISHLEYEQLSIKKGETTIIPDYYIKSEKLLGEQIQYENRTLLITAIETSEFVAFGAINTIVLNDEDFEELLATEEIIDAYKKGTLFDKAYVISYKKALSNDLLAIDLNNILEGHTGNYHLAYNNYVESMSMFGLLCFIGYFVGLVFILMTASLLYFKQIMAASEEKGQYQMLKKLGLSEKQRSRLITKRLLPVFLLPLLTGIIHSIFAMKSADTIVFNNLIASGNTYLTVLASSGVMYGVYIVVYGLFYFITKRQYTKIVTNG